MNKYLYILKMSLKRALQNRPLLIGLSILLGILLITYNQLWVVIGNKENNSMMNTSFIWYLLLGEIIILSIPRMDRIFNDDIKSGTLTYFISKPISFFGMRSFEAIGEMSISFLALFISGGIISYLITGGIPFDLWQLPIIILMCYFSCIINTFLKSAIGLCGLWISNTRYLNLMIERLAFILGGAIIPLSIYPDWFINIAKFTPFYSFYYLTMKLVYDFSYPNLIEALCLNLMWLAIISTFIMIAYRKMAKKVEAYGG